MSAKPSSPAPYPFTWSQELEPPLATLAGEVAELRKAKLPDAGQRQPVAELACEGKLA